MKRCWAESYCTVYPHQCSDICVGYLQLNNIYSQSRMPLKYQYNIPLDCPVEDKDAYFKLKDYQDNVVQMVKNGYGIFIYSPTKGNGKTTWACKIMNQYFRKVALRNNMMCRGLFINIPDFLEQLKDGFNNKEMSDEMVELKEELRKVDLVIWDDIGTETPSNWVRQQLYTFINHRDGNGLANIYTSNLPIATLMEENYLGERIGSRIYGHCSDFLVEFKARVDRRIHND